jgi:hypothetical protein
MPDFIELSKQRHTELESKDYWKCACLIDNNDDSRRHHVMLDECYDMLKSIKLESCLSIGDSRARDAAYAKSKFNCYATASDLNTSKLYDAVQDGFVDSVLDIDVESIPFGDSSVDLVVAKESYHHWPRPFLGLYEMVRVAKKAVALIEPSDCIMSSPTPYVEQGQYEDSYEEVGNYKYQLSLREILKASWSMGLPAVVAKGFNDPYEPNQAFKTWLNKKNELDALGDDGRRQFNLMAILIVKEPAIVNDINLNGGRLYPRPKNPYLT